MVSPPVRLLRLLVRTDDPNIRKQMLRQKVIAPGKEYTKEIIEQDPQSTLSPQCEHIVVSAVQSWGSADVSVKDLEDTIIDVLSQVIF